MAKHFATPYTHIIYGRLHDERSVDVALQLCYFLIKIKIGQYSYKLNLSNSSYLKVHQSKIKYIQHDATILYLSQGVHRKKHTHIYCADFFCKGASRVVSIYKSV